MGFLGMPRSEGAPPRRGQPRHASAAGPAGGIMHPAGYSADLYHSGHRHAPWRPSARRARRLRWCRPSSAPAAQRQEGMAPAFLAEFHDLGAQVGQDVLPGRGLVVLHRGEERNPVVFAMSTSYMLVALAVILALSFVVFRLLTRGRGARQGPVWAGGLRHLWPEIDLYCDWVLQPGPGDLRRNLCVRPPSRTMSRPSPSTFGRRSNVNHGNPRRRSLGIATAGIRTCTAGAARPENACRPCQRVCGLRPLNAAGRACPRSGCLLKEE